MPAGGGAPPKCATGRYRIGEAPHPVPAGRLLDPVPDLLPVADHPSGARLEGYQLGHRFRGAGAQVARRQVVGRDSKVDTQDVRYREAFGSESEDPAKQTAEGFRTRVTRALRIPRFSDGHAIAYVHSQPAHRTSDVPGLS